MQSILKRRLGHWGRAAAVGAAGAALALTAAAPAGAANPPKTNSLTPAYDSPFAPQALIGGIFSGVTVTMRCWRDGAWANGTNRWFLVEGAGYNPYTGRLNFVRGFVSANKIVNQVRVDRCP
ncbi:MULTISPECIES: hypothetical protein [unclassified Streptomyces]|uniref:hypothetical protein n=1 Tax=unclassified Streptomyces TaxID=2593676 RepID=UPI0004C49A08|nr:hypothetical protein [Streptomyces sp. NRRL F-2747]